MILFLNQPKAQCGVYEYGYNTYSILSLYKDKHEFVYLECKNAKDYKAYLDNNNIEAVIANYHPCTLGWFEKVYNLKPCLLMSHDQVFDFGDLNLILDPTFESAGKNYSVPRTLFEFNQEVPVKKDTISTFGFAFEHKGFLELLERVSIEYNQATLRIHMPKNSIVGCRQNRLSLELKRKVKSYINLEITNDYKSKNDLLKWLAESELNAFLYRGSSSNGIASCTDWAISVGRPLAITNDKMFRHLPKELSVDQSSLKQILQKKHLVEEIKIRWSSRKLYDKYCEAINVAKNLRS